MPVFAYETSDGSGVRSSGVLTAASEDRAQRMLVAEGKFVLQINPIAGEEPKQAAKSSPRSGGGIQRSDVIFFATQMAVMVETGVPLADALVGIANHISKPAIRRVINEVADGVQSGQPMSECMARFPKVFPSIMVSLIAAGESSGNLGTMLDRTAEYLAKEDRIAKQVRSGLAYPTFMLGLCMTVTVFLLTFVLPKFEAIYANRGASLPAPTQFLLKLSGGFTSNWHWIVLGGAAAILSLVLWFRTKTGLIQLDWMKLNLPIIGGASRALYLTRSARTATTLISAGISLLDVIASVRRVVANHYFTELWEQADNDLRVGKQLSDTFFASPLMPGPIAQMIESGEKAGRLELVFNRVADFTEEQFDRAVKNALKFIEPLMILVLGSIIGFIAIALLLPIFEAGKVMSSN